MARIQKHKTNKYDKLITAASRVMSRKGYKGATLNEIAAAAGIHKSTLYYYFKNKEALLLAVLKISIVDVTENLNHILQNKNLTPEEKLRQSIITHLNLLEKYRDNVNVYLHETRFLSPKNRKKYIASRKYYALCFKKIIDEIKANDTGCFKGLDSTIVTFGVLGMCNWVVKWYKGSKKYNTSEIADIFYRMLMKVDPQQREDSPQFPESIFKLC